MHTYNTNMKKGTQKKISTISKRLKICYYENYLYPTLQFDDFQKELDSCMRLLPKGYASNKKNGILNG